jgi:hypothetical protein
MSDGSWYSQNEIMETRYAATTWVIISLPKYHDRAMGIDVTVGLELPDDVTLTGSDPEARVEGSRYEWDVADVDDLGREIELDLAVHDLDVDEVREIASAADVTVIDEYAGSEATMALAVPSITGLPTFVVDAGIDVAEYGHSTDASIDVTVKNVSREVASGTLEVTVRDAQGSGVAGLLETDIEGLAPAGLAGKWAYRIPLTATGDRDISRAVVSVEVDFEDALASLGRAGAALDEASLRVLEFDATGNILGEVGIDVEFTSETVAEVAWLVEDQVSAGEQRSYYLYFDTLDNGPKAEGYRVDVDDVGESFVMYGDDYSYMKLIRVNEDGTFGEASKTSVSYSNYRQRIGIADFDNDGHNDLIVSYGDLYFVRNTGEDIYSYEKYVHIDATPSYYWFTDVVTGDFNNDGNMDFVTDYWSFGSTRLYPGRGDGTFEDYVSLPSPPGSGYYGPKASGDFDGDGDLDLVLSDGCRTVYYFDGKGDGTFTYQRVIRSGGRWCSFNNMVSGDFDGDGLDDIIITGTRDHYLMRSNGDGTFTEEGIESLDSYYDVLEKMVAGDLNGDGITDLVVSNAPYYYALRFHAGNGDGTFGPASSMKYVSRKYPVMLDIGEGAPLPRMSVQAGEPEPVPSVGFTLTWNTGTTFAGPYEAYAHIIDDTGLEADDAAAFEILADMAFSSRISTDKANYEPGERVEVSSSVTSESVNALFENLTALIEVRGEDGTVSLTEEEAIAALVPGQRIEFSTALEVLDNVEPGAYSALFEVSDGTSLLTSSQAAFEVLGTAETGEGLEGTLAASPDTVKSGASLDLLYSVRNDGNEDVSDLAVTVAVVDPDTGQLISAYDTAVDLGMGMALTGGFAADTSGMEARTYLAALQVQAPAMAEARTLASTTFEVERPTVEAEKAVGDIRYVLVWLNYNWQSGKDCPDVSVIENALNAAGVEYTLVYERKDFQAELRSPFYTDYLILGDHSPLENHYADELREKVFSGRGLISSMYNRQSLDESVFGIKVTGNLSGEDHLIELAESEISTGDGFQSAGRALKTEALDDEEVIGRIIRTRKKGTEEYPAIIMRSYGLGNVLFYAFDLGLGSLHYETFESLLKNSLAYSHRPFEPAETYYPYQLVPVTVSLENQGEAMDILVYETYPSEIHLFDPVEDEWVADNPWMSNVHLEGNESITFHALTPDVSGTFTLHTEVGYLENGEYNFIQDLDLDLDLTVVDTATLLADTVDALSTISVSQEDEEFVIEAIMHLQEVQNRITPSEENAKDNIHDIVMAINSMLSVTSTDTSEIILGLDRLLAAWEGRWYFGE